MKGAQVWHPLPGRGSVAKGSGAENTQISTLNHFPSPVLVVILSKSLLRR